MVKIIHQDKISDCPSELRYKEIDHFAKALKWGWEIPEEVRQKTVELIIKMLAQDNLPHRDRINTIRLLTQMTSQNIQQDIANQELLQGQPTEVKVTFTQMPSPIVLSQIPEPPALVDNSSTDAPS